MKIVEKDFLSGAEILIKDLCVGGDDIKLFEQNFQMLRSIAVVLGEVYAVQSANIKKN